MKFKNKLDKVKMKEYSPRINTLNENPVVTQEKERERILHRTVISNILYKFSLNNYYRLNLLLKDLTLNQLYYQPFIDKKSIQKSILEDKRSNIIKNMRDHFNKKEEIQLFKIIINKINNNEKSSNVIKVVSYDSSILKNSKYIIEKIFNYLFIEKNKKNKIEYILKVFHLKDNKIVKKKGKLDLNKFLKNTIINIKFKSVMNKSLFLNESKKNILNNDKLTEMKKISIGSFSEYIEKEKLEKTNNQLLYSTVKKYNEEKTKVGWKNEFSETFVLKEKKNNMVSNDGPDLSRRNKK